MIGWLRGVIRLRDPITGIVILDVGGVGYQLMVSWQTFSTLPPVDETCTLWVHTHVREDALALYGFATAEERQMFLLLTSVPQVGPKNAVMVLGGFPLEELISAIATGERATLERIPGVGKRTADRILLDLREKVERLRPAEETSQAPSSTSEDALREEARAVLINLGWKSKAVDQALAQASDEAEHNGSLDGLVRRGLALLMKV